MNDYEEKREENKRKKVLHQNILNYWKTKLDETEFNFDFSEGLIYCWACGNKSLWTKLEAAHIIPHALNGKSAPENLLLFCSQCNRENPHSLSSKEFLNWMKRQRVLNKTGLYETIGANKIFKLFKEKNDRDLLQELVKLFYLTGLDFNKELLKFRSMQSKNFLEGNLETNCIFYEKFLIYVDEKLKKRETKLSPLSSKENSPLSSKESSPLSSPKMFSIRVIKNPSKKLHPEWISYLNSTSLNKN